MKVVIVGGGFAGLYAAKSLKDFPAEITLIDKRNFHLFQPLLYQVATGGLSGENIIAPLRKVFKKQSNTRVVMNEVVAVDPQNDTVICQDAIFKYDVLVMATGVQNFYFGHDEAFSPGLKTVEDAIEIRKRIFSAFEEAEISFDSKRREELMTFAIVGGGPTGVELAGAIAEIATETLAKEFRTIDPRKTRIVLIEALPNILSTYPQKLSTAALSFLQRMGVTVMTNTQVEKIIPNLLTLNQAGRTENLAAATILWAAGVRATSISYQLAKATESTTDKQGRIVVTPYLNLENYENIYVIGDLAHCKDQFGNALPGIAPVAMQQGRYVAQCLWRQKKGRPLRVFRYRFRGNLATVGRSKAVADLGKLKMSGKFAWFLWIFVHIFYLILFQNRILVLLQWAWYYFSFNRGARIIVKN